MKSLKCISVFPLILAVLIIWPQVSIAQEVDGNATKQDTLRQRSAQDVRHEAQQKRQRSEQKAHYDAQKQEGESQQSVEGAQTTEAAAISEELKQIQIQYHETRAAKAKERLHARAQNLITQLYQTEVRRKVKRIKAIEARLAEEKKSLEGLHSRKQEMINSGTEQALQTGDMPKWGP